MTLCLVYRNFTLITHSTRKHFMSTCEILLGALRPFTLVCTDQWNIALQS